MNTFKKLIELLPPSAYKETLFLFILIFIMAVINTLGVASILPFISVAVNPELIETNTILSTLFEMTKSLGITSKINFLFFLGVVVFVLLITSLAINAITLYFQVKFAFLQEQKIGRRLTEIYLNQPYAWFLKQHSANLGRNILSEVNQAIVGILMPSITAIVQSVLIIFIFTLLFIVEPKLTLFVILFSLTAYGTFFFSIKNYLVKLGKERVKSNLDRYKIISDAFSAIKEVKFLHLENLFVTRFTKPAKIYADNQATSQVLAFLPRFFIEAIAFGGIIVLMLSLMHREENFLDVMPIISLYAFAGYRALPAIQQLYAAISQIKFASPALENLYKDIKNLKNFDKHNKLNSKMSFSNSISLQNIHFSHQNSSKETVSNININIPALSKFGIVGPTGSGKTTLIDIILGLLEPTKGNIKVDNQFIEKKNIRSWQKNIGYVPQDIYLSDASIASNIAFGVNDEKIDFKLVKEVAKKSGLHDFIINELKNGYDTQVGERGVRLSGGQKQRIGIARALYNNPSVIILDEGTSALDNVTEKNIMDAISNLKIKKTIIVIAHRLKTLRDCDSIIFLNNGKVISQGTYSELLKINKDFAKMDQN